MVQAAKDRALAEPRVGGVPSKRRLNQRLVKAYKGFKQTTELQFGDYAISLDPQEVARVIKENTGSQGLTEFDLDRVKVPTGGRTKWEVPGLDGEMQDMKSFEGVIVYFKDARRYWAEQFEKSGGGVPPDCYAESDDNGKMFGRGEPGGDCETCPFAQFGSDPKGGRGQACRAVRALFIIRPEEVMPTVLPLPPTSIGMCRKYFLRMGSKSIPYYAVITRFGLRKATAKGSGQDYGEVVFAASAILDPERSDKDAPSQVEIVEAYQEQVMPKLRRMRVADADFVHTEDAEDVEEYIRRRDGLAAEPGGEKKEGESPPSDDDE